MRVIPARSSFYIKVDNTDSANLVLESASCDVFVWTGSVVPTVPQFPLNQRVISTTTPFLIFEIGELIRDFLDVEYNGTTYSTPPVNVRVVVNRVFTDESTTSETYNYVALDGYSAFEDGMQIEDGTTVTYSEGQYLGSGEVNGTNIHIHGIDNEVIRVPLWDATNNTVVYDTIPAGTDRRATIGTNTYIIDRDDVYEKRPPIRITFVNKAGVLDSIWATRKHVDIIKVNNDEYYQNIVNFTDGNYNIHRHSKQKYNVIGYRSITVNTNNISERLNNMIQEMYMSEQVWITEGNVTTPVLLENKSLPYKTHVNDQLVQYEWTFNYSNRIDNTIR